MKITPRIKKELTNLKKEIIEGIEIEPNPSNFNHFYVKIHGPSETPYENGIFKAQLLLPSDYPLSPPKLLLDTKIFHPNIDKLGRVCLDILKNNWTPALQIRSVLLSFQALLAAPDENDFLNLEAAELFQKNKKAGQEKAKEWTKLYANVK